MLAVVFAQQRPKGFITADTRAIEILIFDRVIQSVQIAQADQEQTRQQDWFPGLF